ncbi:hypothetical protein [Helicobacter pylori]|uniref:hypothetical protein n=1 Tax=Helicobacter pylori TaxID=210 RepID=UPI001237F546|nr:hypothetical protein [Helicobacter pylori]KAA6513297.1 hypothetical protein EPC80_03785 [Helicobacter pylori]
MKHLTPFTHTLFKALWLGTVLSTSLSLVAAESPTKTEPKPAKGVKNKPKSPVTKVMMTNCDNLKDFNAKQKEVLKAAYQFGSKENLGYEMAGIAWKESCAGVYKINFSDPSAGVYHSYIPSVLKSYGHNDSPFLRNVMGELLIKDDAFASEVALKELIYWKTRYHYHDNLKDMIKSYNKGSRWEKNEKSNADAEKYYEEIQDKIRRLKESKIFDSQSSNDQELQKSANSNLDLDPIGNAMPQALIAKETQTEETQAEKSQEMKEATSEQTKSKPEKAKDKPMYLAQINSADFTPAKKSPKKPAKANPKRSSKNNIKNNVKSNTKTASKKQEMCKNCSPGQRNAILANHITLMQEL